MMISGVPKNERWWLRALAVWIICALGPGLEIGNRASYIGYFPFLYVWNFAFWVLAIVLAYFLAFKVHFHDVPTDITAIQDERQGG
ncbi:MAG: hypothetical protein LBC55_00810 [Desulfovibrio sp.]|jgi:hypothetical protein|nr:hypothetical protein [Desulfovibrio sp.]